MEEREGRDLGAYRMGRKEEFGEKSLNETWAGAGAGAGAGVGWGRGRGFYIDREIGELGIGREQPHNSLWISRSREIGRAHV